MRLRCPTLLLAAACAAPAAFGQQAGPVGTPARDVAAVSIAQVEFIVSRLADECLALVGRAESPRTLVATWRQRNSRFVSASALYLDKRLDEAVASGGPEQREAGLARFRTAVRDLGESTTRQLLQGRKDDSCMRAITLLDTGTFDISSKLPQYEQLEALVKWAEQ